MMNRDRPRARLAADDPRATSTRRATLRGANFVGSPQQVIEKILFQHEIFGHDRFLLQFSVGTMPHDEMHALDRAVRHRGRAPAVRRELAGPADHPGRVVASRLRAGQRGPTCRCLAPGFEPQQPCAESVNSAAVRRAARYVARACLALRFSFVRGHRACLEGPWSDAVARVSSRPRLARSAAGSSRRAEPNGVRAEIRESVFRNETARLGGVVAGRPDARQPQRHDAAADEPALRIELQRQQRAQRQGRPRRCSACSARRGCRGCRRSGGRGTTRRPRSVCGPDANTRLAPASIIACANARGLPRCSPRNISGRPVTWSAATPSAPACM